jgi:hypothetical protein
MLLQPVLGGIQDDIAEPPADREARAPDLDQQPHDRVAINVGHRLDAADAVAFHKATDDLDPAVEQRKLAAILTGNVVDY